MIDLNDSHLTPPLGAYSGTRDLHANQHHVDQQMFCLGARRLSIAENGHSTSHYLQHSAEKVGVTAIDEVAIPSFRRLFSGMRDSVAALSSNGLRSGSPTGTTGILHERRFSQNEPISAVI